MRHLASVTLSGLLIAAGLATQGLHAQAFISAQSGVVHYVEGRVLIGSHAVDARPGQFPAIKEGEVMSTEEGRAEILLTPGVFLRVAENSSIRMVSTHLTDTRVELLTGSALVEVADIPKDNAVTLLYKDRSISLRKTGLYRVDAEPARAAVYQGEAVVSAGSDQLTLKNGKQAPLDGVLVAEGFTTKEGGAGDDALFRWSKRRDGYDSLASVYAAHSVLDDGMSPYQSQWRFNPYFGMYSFVPGSYLGYSPFGFSYFSPGSAYQAYFYDPFFSPFFGFGNNYGYGYGYVPPVSGGSSGLIGSPSSGGVSSGMRPIGNPRLPPIHNGSVLAGNNARNTLVSHRSYSGGGSSSGSSSSHGHFGSSTGTTTTPLAGSSHVSMGSGSSGGHSHK